MPTARSMTSQRGTGEIRWRKSSKSFSNGNCVEVANLPNGNIGVRDSKHPELGYLEFSPWQWHAFLCQQRLRIAHSRVLMVT
jgi:hypothetical protein